MKGTVLVAAATAFLLTGCACNVAGIRDPDPAKPGVSVRYGKQIVVDQEPIFFEKGRRDVTITWQLPADSPYSFSEKDGILFADTGGEIVGCRPEPKGRAYSCLNKHTKPGKYKYTIKLDGSPVVPALDPTVVND